MPCSTTSSQLSSRSFLTSTTSDSDICFTIPRIESQNFILYEVKEPCPVKESTENKTSSDQTSSDQTSNDQTSSDSSCTTFLRQTTTENSCISITESSEVSTNQSCNYSSSSESGCDRAPTIHHYFSDGSITIVGRTFDILDDDPVIVYEMTNCNNMSVHVLTYGARFHKIKVPDRNGVTSNVILSCETLEEYLECEELYLNATIGRTTGMIKNARFCINNESFFVSQNLNENHHINGGTNGIDKINWKSCVDGRDVLMTCISRDMNEGYPGTMFIQARFQLSENNEVRVIYTARVTMPCPCNISTRMYFNLAETTENGTLYDHFLNINANYYTYNFSDGTPYKKLKNVTDTEYDLRLMQQLGIAIARHPEQGYDCLYKILSKNTDDSLNFVAKVLEPSSRRAFELYTTQNFVWFNTCNDSEDPNEIMPNYDLSFLNLKPFPKRVINVKGKNKRKSESNRSLTKIHQASVKFLSELGIESSLIKQNITKNHSDLTIHDSNQTLTNFEMCEDEEELKSLSTTKPKFLKHSAFYFQPQNFPNAVNHQATYPDIILRPGQTYKNEIVIKFGIHTGMITVREEKPEDPKPNPCCEPECPRKFLSRCCDYCDENCVKCSMK